MDLWFTFILNKESSELDALLELSSCNLCENSLIEDIETGERILYGIADPLLFPSSWTHIASYTKIENVEIDWCQEWNTFSPYFQDGLAKIPLSNFSPHSSEILTLLPGPGFGDLSHPTTCLSLELLAKYTLKQTIIDLGCGSGILGLAALKWGARFVYGLDISFKALEHSQENALFNQLENKIFISFSLPDSLEDLPTLLVMNMTFADQKQALKSLSFYPPLWITSGILKKQKKAYLSWAEQKGLKLKDCIEKDEWIACVFNYFS